MASKVAMSKEAKDLAGRVRALTKSVEEKQPATTITVMLESLRKEVVVTEELLRLTKAGVIVNKLKQHEDKGVQVLANQIVQKWKGEINAKTARDRSAKVPAAATASKPTVPPLERTKEKDGVDCARTGDTTRDACIGLLYNGLCYGSDALPQIILKHAINVEKAAYQQAGSLTSGYKSKIRSLFANLKNVKNPSLRVSVLSGEISADRLVTMSSEELASPERRAENEKIREVNIREAQVAKPEKSISTALKCGKCGQKQVSYSQAQTRSADEPMTTFCECVVCGNRWKFS